MLVLNKFKKFKVYALRFCKTRRAFYSFVLLALAYLLSLTSPWTVNDEPVDFEYKGYRVKYVQNITDVASASGRQAIEEVKAKQRVSGFNSIFAVS